MRTFFAALLIIAMFSTIDVFAQSPQNPQAGDRISGQYFETRSPVVATHGMGATAQPLASQVAIDILKKGGNAVDAAIAANAALGLMEPVANGLGGDLFAIIWDPKTKKLYGLNASGRAPKGQSLAQLKERLHGADEIPPVGPLPVSVPGAADGWFAMNKRFGKLPMSAILAPAIDYAQNGFALTEVIAFYWDLNMQRLEQAHAAGLFTAFDNARATYLVDGHTPVEGEVFKNPDLANTLRLLAKDGRNAFYKGPIARTIDAYMKRIGGPLRYEDFASHHSQWVEPKSVNYRGYDVWELPPNGQGIAALQMLNILEGFDMKAASYMSAKSLHYQIEAKRLAFEDRAKFYADPDFVKVPVKQLLSKEYAARRRALIDPQKAMADIGPGDPKAIENGDTTYLTVADADGMMVSLIQSNYRGMGSGLVPDGLGFMLQNRGQLFALKDGDANVYAPGKRPFHTIIPAFVTKDGKPWMSFGLMGGAMQPQGHVQIIVNMIDYGLNVQAAGDAPRWRHDGSAQPTGAKRQGVGVVHLENGVPQDVRDQLTAMGYTLGPSDGGFGGYQAIRVNPETGVYSAASEMRKDGAAIGY